MQFLTLFDHNKQVMYCYYAIEASGKSGTGILMAQVIMAEMKN